MALPSLKEGWGIVVMEAAARGVPTVAYAEAGGVRESIVDEVTGFVVEGGIAAFTAATDRLLSDGELRLAMRRRLVLHGRQIPRGSRLRCSERLRLVLLERSWLSPALCLSKLSPS